MVAAQVARTPYATALIHGDRRWSYDELDTRANQLAHALAAAGVTRGSRVGVCCTRSLEMIAAVIGVAKAGAAYVPIDPDHPRARRDLIIRDAGIAVVVAQHQLAGELPARAIAIDRELATPCTPPRVPLDGDDTLYVLYTSGSTGQPKGVPGIHRAVANRLRWQQQAYPYGPDEVASARTPLGFVDSVAEIFAPLAFGVPMVVLDGAAQRDVAQSVAQLAAAGATRIVLVPSLLATMLDVVPDLGRRVPRLHYWFVGGEPIPVPLVTRFRAELPGRALVNIYGATELTADATFFDFDRLPELPAGLTTSPIGVPLPGVHARIVDASLREVTAGATGEIVISGTCLAPGYLDRPDLTAARFVSNPFPEGGRLYRTRDLGRRLPSGDLQYLGRLDRLVKIRGVGVELDEVEATLSMAPGVTHAAAIAVDDQLLAFYTSTATAGARELRAFVAAHLPAAAVPGRFICIERFPINSNGKIDREALAAMPRDHQDRGALPATPNERRVAAIWEAVLGHAPIGRDQDFFDIGGTSLAAMRVVARLREELGLDMPVAVLFEHPSVAALADWIVRARPAVRRAAIAVSNRPLPRVLPLSHYQFPFWMFHALTGESSIVAEVFAFSERVDLDRLQAAFARTVARFDTLWMRYPRLSPTQELAPRSTCCIEVSTTDDASTEAAHNNARRFDLMSPPHVHARLVRSRDRDRLVVAMPHVAVDMAAMEIFRCTLETFYAGDTPAASSGASLADLVEWERGFVGGHADDERYWRTIASGPAVQALPARLFARRRERAWSSRPVPPAMMARIAELARRHALTTPTVLVGGIYAALARTAECDDPTVLVMIDKRDRSELRDLFSNLTGAMPCRVDRSRGPTSDVALRVARQVLTSAAHTDHLMRRPTLWNDFWTRAPRPVRRLVETLGARIARRWPIEPELVAQWLFALVPAFERKANRVMFSINVLPEVTNSRDRATSITSDRELPAMLKPDDLITGADALLDRTLQVHVTHAGGVAVNLYGGGVSQHGLDEITTRIVDALAELA